MRITIAIIAAALSLTSLSAADPTTGSLWGQGLLRSEKVDVYRVNLDEDYTRVVVQGDGDGDIDCQVQTTSLKTIASDTTATDGCDLLVRSSGYHRIVVYNKGEYPTNYLLRAY